MLIKSIIVEKDCKRSEVISDMISGMIAREKIRGDIIFIFTGLTVEQPEESESGC